MTEGYKIIQIYDLENVKKKMSKECQEPIDRRIEKLKGELSDRAKECLGNLI